MAAATSVVNGDGKNNKRLKL